MTDALRAASLFALGYVVTLAGGGILLKLYLRMKGKR